MLRRQILTFLAVVGIASLCQSRDALSQCQPPSSDPPGYVENCGGSCSGSAMGQQYLPDGSDSTAIQVTIPVHCTATMIGASCMDNQTNQYPIDNQRCGTCPNSCNFNCYGTTACSCQPESPGCSTGCSNLSQPPLGSEGASVLLAKSATSIHNRSRASLLGTTRSPLAAIR